MSISIKARATSSNSLRLVPDWAEHSYCWMAWAFHPEWDSLLRSAKQELLDLIVVISRYEPVRLLTPPQAISEAQSCFAGRNVEIVSAPVDDIWMRDIAPVYAMRGNHAVPIDLNFNGWGNSEYRESRPGDRLASLGSHLFGTSVYAAPFIAEGGALVIDGNGVVYTSRSCLLHKQRNPNVSQSEIERALIELGASRVIWLEGDEDEIITNGHVDGYVLPTESGDVIIQTADHEQNASARSADIGSIRAALLQIDPKASVVLISPPRNLKTRNSMFAGSYLNVYTPNGAVIMPAFGDEKGDFEAQQAIRRAFPAREIAVVNINSLASGGGGVRCLVQPVPISS
ncbi:agmatine deiminase family protein [Bradyrhizobium acaciae]|uniref:agmatine deiminase family protein n=1 Tax=Bradyrhizobium acaciae TaxID=2683706 RepID=UPI003084085F|nr:agmatine deiminase family protein [Bradyrhizobium acaciae]